MRRRVPRPIEYVVSSMRLMDEYETTAHGVIVSPCYVGDDRSKFEGEQGDLVIAIEHTTSTKVAAYDDAIAHFTELRRMELLKERMVGVDVEEESDE